MAFFTSGFFFTPNGSTPSYVPKVPPPSVFTPVPPSITLSEGYPLLRYHAISFCLSALRLPVLTGLKHTFQIGGLVKTVTSTFHPGGPLYDFPEFFSPCTIFSKNQSFPPFFDFSSPESYSGFFLGPPDIPSGIFLDECRNGVDAPLPSP